jgi:hypothetical protein
MGTAEHCSAADGCSLHVSCAGALMHAFVTMERPHNAKSHEGNADGSCSMRILALQSIKTWYDKFEGFGFKTRVSDVS